MYYDLGVTKLGSMWRSVVSRDMAGERRGSSTTGVLARGVDVARGRVAVVIAVQSIVATDPLEYT